MKKPYSIKLYKTSSNQWKDGSYPVCLVVYKARKRKYISLGIGAMPYQWNNELECYVVDKRIKDLHPDREEYNNWLIEVKSRCKEIIDDFSRERIDWTLNQFEQRYLDKSKHSSVESYFQKHIEKLMRLGKIGTKNSYEATLKILKIFDSKFGKLSFQDIDYKYISRFDEYLRADRGNENITIKYHMKTFRSLINKAIRDGEASTSNYPFGKYGYSIAALEQETEKRYLPNEYIESLKNAKLENLTLSWVRNLFLFSYYCQGMAIIDMAYLKKRNVMAYEGGKYIVYRRQKTESKNSKILRIKITEPIQQILDWFKTNSSLVDDYLLPVVSISGYEGEKLYTHVRDRYKKYNRHLKKLGERLEFKDIRLSSYMSRHTYAMRLKNSGVSEDIISEALGHKDLSTTKVYLDSFQKDEIARANELL